MTTPISGSNAVGHSVPAGAPSIEFRRMATSDTLTLVSVDKTGRATVDPAVVAEFNRLPVDQQTAILQRLLAEALKSGDPAVKMAVTAFVAGVVTATAASALKADFDAVDRQLSALPPGHVPTRLPTPEAHAALVRLRAGTASPADYQLLRGPGNQDMLPNDRAMVARKLAMNGDENAVRDVLGGAPTRDAALQALAILGDGMASRGWIELNMMLHDDAEAGDVISNALNRTRRDIERELNAAGPSAMIPATAETFAISATGSAVAPADSTVDNAGIAPADVTADDAAAAPPGQAVDSSGLAPPPTPTRDLSAAEKQQHFDRARAAASADGTLSIGDQFLLIEAALDPHQYYNRLMGSDPDLILQLKDNPGLLESVKTVVAAMNAAKDALSAIHDDVNQRRKKAAESLSRA